jgi:hypothetical protein
MTSRYDMMTTSSVADPIGNEPYPDTLSVNYADFTYSQPPVQFDPDDRFIRKPYLLSYVLYKVTYYDDILLMINNIPHLSKMADKPFIYLPVLEDMTRFVSL